MWKLHNINLDNFDIMVSYVVFLFTKVPVKNTL